MGEGVFTNKINLGEMFTEDDHGATWVKCEPIRGDFLFLFVLFLKNM